MWVLWTWDEMVWDEVANLVNKFILSITLLKQVSKLDRPWHAQAQYFNLQIYHVPYHKKTIEARRTSFAPNNLTCYLFPMFCRPWHTQEQYYQYRIIKMSKYPLTDAKILVWPIEARRTSFVPKTCQQRYGIETYRYGRYKHVRQRTLELAHS